MAIGNLKAQIARLPRQPGVYLYLGRNGETLYVGKARVLRDRVRSYLTAYGTSPKTDALLDEVERLEFIVTDSVVEALVLENHLIKERTPRYNILLRDDKNYPYLRLTTSEAAPRVLVARRVERDGDFYAGPFLPATFARKTMSLTHRLFGMRSCNEVINGRRDRPCLEYDIKRCIAPCVETICSLTRYREAAEDTRLFLEGRNDELIAELRRRMLEASEAERFEQAAQLRDAIRTIEALRDRQQKMSTPQLGDRDALGVKVGPAGAVMQVFQMRHGRVIERAELITEADRLAGPTEAEVIEAGIQQYYEVRVPPPEVHVASRPRDPELLESWLSERAGRRVRIVEPKRGDKRQLLELATRNAGLAYHASFDDQVAAHAGALESLRVSLALLARPRRIDCFDVSTIQGSETVASMVVCEDGRMRRGQYRKFRIRSLHGSADDFAAMREVVVRRYRRVLERGGPFPDLLLIDGGTGQLSAAYAALDTLGLANLVAVGLAKKEELVVTRDRRDPIRLPRDDAGLLLLQRIRDEAHRFAVTFHRRARAMRDLRSELDAVPGIGPRRRRALLTRFGSVSGVRRATREELATVVGNRTAGALLAYFEEQKTVAR
jgi:excinuclease ABC subunit C